MTASSPITASWLRDNWRPLSALLMAIAPLLRMTGLVTMSDEAFNSVLTAAGLFIALYASARTAEKIVQTNADARVLVAEAGVTVSGNIGATADAVLARVTENVNQAVSAGVQVAAEAALVRVTDSVAAGVTASAVAADVAVARMADTVAAGVTASAHAADAVLARVSDTVAAGVTASTAAADSALARVTDSVAVIAAAVDPSAAQAPRS